MITQVSGLNGNRGIVKDPRRKAQSVRFKHRPMTAYKQNCAFHEAGHSAQRDAVIRSGAICAVGALFTIGYLAATGLERAGRFI